MCVLDNLCAFQQLAVCACNYVWACVCMCLRSCVSEAKQAQCFTVLALSGYLPVELHHKSMSSPPCPLHLPTGFSTL